MTRPFNSPMTERTLDERIADARGVGAKAVAVWITEIEEMRAEIAWLRRELEQHADPRAS